MKRPKQIKLILLLVSLLQFLISSAQITALNGQPISGKNMDKFLLSQIDSLAFPSLSVAFINKGKIVYHRSFGFADLELKKKADEQTVYEAASMSKTVFAYLVLKLVDKGLMALDTPLYRYLPNKDLAYDDRYKLITARMVLSHATGMPNWRDYDLADSSLHIKKGDLYLKFKPGSGFSYSGEAYQYLVAVVNQLLQTSNKGLDSIWYREVAKPLGMKNARFYWNDYIRQHRATGYTQKDDNKINTPGTLKTFEEFGAAGGLRTNALDYANFMIGLMNQVGLSPKSFQEMFSKQNTVPDNEEAEFWGLGLAMKNTPNGIRYMHSGSNGDFTCYYVFYREQKSGFVFLTNCNRAGDLFDNLVPYFNTGRQNGK